ncbi:MAG TPA: isoleucine--tRNA ligase [Bacteroidia bacterium]|nr:isoleucine--tRNA ligase [Bacteroidia bacterium]
MSKFPQYENLNLSEIGKEVLEKWAKENTFEKSVSLREGAKTFTFYEGPPSANGMPGIHHVMARTIKDIFCRYHTMKGFKVERKGGWDTHGLPIELSVEKSLGITKEDIGKKITVEEYNAACRQEVMKYKDKWEEVTTKMGYWVDMNDPYITFDNNYIESVWYLLGELYKKKMLYKGYTIQPYSWAAGTGLSSHELNQPGCYKNIKDTSITAQFKVIKDSKSEFLFNDNKDVYFLAWTTTPWTLPSNCALAVGKDIKYALVNTYQPYMGNPIKVILALDLVHKYFHEKAADIAMEDYKHGDRYVPYKIEKTFTGKELEGIKYEQLMPYVKPEGKAFEVIIGDFVTTDDGAGIVHTASLFGADDFRVCNQNGISAIYVKDADGNNVPLVNKQGKFVKEVTDFAGMHVKTKEDQEHPEKSTDLAIALLLKREGKAFKIEKIEHSYPHCWRTDQPVIYYPLDSWFVKTTAMKDRMIALNKTINWKPESTGTGRFGNWLENMVDWNLSRSRFWGIPLPIWRTEDGKEEICIGNYQDLDEEIKKSLATGIMTEEDLKKSKWNTTERDIHKPYCDNIFLVSPSGKKMTRESDLIDVWFDSGSMPYAQWHYPFENQEKFKENFPADFIAEGVDQTRGWFFTLHAIASMLFDSVAFKNVVSNGLVLDKHGNKMSKRLGNAVDPFKIIEQYGADATRWYMISNAQPWDNLKFDEEGITEVQRKLFRALYNTYAFYALYANIDGFNYSEKEIPVDQRPELDQWILSVLNSLIKRVDEFYATYEPMRAARDIEAFVTDQLSNWYVRLSRRRFWKGEYSDDKIAAFQTLYTCLETIAKLIAPIAPFFSEKLFTDLNGVSGKEKVQSIHHSLFPVSDVKSINPTLEERMDLAQRISSLTLALRKKVNIRVRQPLNKILIPILDESLRHQIDSIKSLILAEVNVKELHYVHDTDGMLNKKIKANFKELGKKLGPLMKEAAASIASFGMEEIKHLETTGKYGMNLSGREVEILLTDVEITSEDMPGWHLMSDGKITVALDTMVTKELEEEGIARELINRIQNLRKEKNYEVTDKITLQIKRNKALESAVENNFAYICSEILATSFEMVDNLDEGQAVVVEVADNLSASIFINKSN